MFKMISLKQKMKGPPNIRGQGKEGSFASRRGVHSWRMDIRKNGQLYLFLIPAVVSVFLFNYLPMYGVQIAFKDFRPAEGIWGSRWVGWKWFERFFDSYQFQEIISNTLILSVLLLWGTYQVI